MDVMLWIVIGLAGGLRGASPEPLGSGLDRHGACGVRHPDTPHAPLGRSTECQSQAHFGRRITGRPKPDIGDDVSDHGDHRSLLGGSSR